MPQLAENSFFNARYSMQEERARTEKRRAVESLTDVGSFQSQSVLPSLKTAGHGQKGLWETSPDVFQISEISEAFVLKAALGSTIPLAIPDVKLLRVPAAKEAALLSIETPTRIITDVKHPSLQGVSIADLVVRENVFRASLFPDIRAEAPKAHKQKITPEITDEAKRRLADREYLQEKLHSIMEEEASGLNISLKRIAVRPGWSHEYEDLSGVVIEVEMAGNDDQRFVLWDAISFRLDALLDSLTPDEQAFIANNVSVVVTQGEV